jgi:hypothetical protein
LSVWPTLLFAGNDAEAVGLDLVQPFAAGRQVTVLIGRHGAMNPAGKGTLQHVGLIDYADREHVGLIDYADRDAKPFLHLTDYGEILERLRENDVMLFEMRQNIRVLAEAELARQNRRAKIGIFIVTMGLVFVGIYLLKIFR